MNPAYLSVEQARKLNNANPDNQLALVGDKLRLALNGSIGFPQNSKYYADCINGDDAYDGLSWESAFRTIQKACDVARWVPGTTTIDTARNRHKFIFIAPGQYNEQILFSGYNIRLIGCSPLSNGDYGVVINYDDAIDDTCVFGFTGAGLEVANICFQTTKAIPIMLLGTGGNVADASWIHHCWLKGANDKTPTIGISAEIKNSIIEHVDINGVITGINFASGVWFNNSKIRKIKFTNVTNLIAVASDAVATESEISKCAGIGSATGIVNSSSNDILIYGNHTKPAISDGGAAAGDNTTLA
jgi:hypothetical protein